MRRDHIDQQRGSRPRCANHEAAAGRLRNQRVCGRFHELRKKVCESASSLPGDHETWRTIVGENIRNESLSSLELVYTTERQVERPTAPPSLPERFVYDFQPCTVTSTNCPTGSRTP